MPAQLTYPGVYVEELPSGVRTITGVATSITAFIGRAERGPIDEPVVINSYGDFERIFGGLWTESRLGYAVRDFYLNGGAQAIIVRVFRDSDSDPTPEARAFASIKATEDADIAVTDLKALNVPADPQPPGPDSLDPIRAILAQVESEAAEALTTARADVLAYLDSVIAEQQGIMDDSSKSQAERDAAKIKRDATIGNKANAQTAANAGALKALLPTTPTSSPTTAPSHGYARISANGLNLKAAYPGVWGNALRARITRQSAAIRTEKATDWKVNADDLFDLTVRDTATGQSESYINVVLKPSHRRDLIKLLKDGSKLVHVDVDKGATTPTAHQDPSPIDRLKIWTDNQYSAGSDNAGNDGGDLTANEFIGDGKFGAKQGLYALEKADLFNLLYIPPFIDIADPNGGDIEADVTKPELIPAAVSYCEGRRAMFLLDSPSSWVDKDKARHGAGGDSVITTSKNAAMFFPRCRQSNILRDGQIEVFGVGGAVAGVFARTDTTRGVWKAPAGVDDGTLLNVPELTVKLTDAENGELNPLGLNCLRSFPVYGRVVWGSRTANGADARGSEWKYIPVRRTALFIEETLYRSTKWVVFEPNDERLWAQIRLNVGAFMHRLFRQGAFQTISGNPRDSYFVKCDKETTTQTDINLGIVNILVGFAPLKPAEFVIIQIQQMPGDIET